MRKFITNPSPGWDVSLQPLQVPGGPELLILLVVLLVVFGLVGRWVYRDAKSRGSDWAWQWGVGIGLLFLFGLVPGLLGLLIYVTVRDEVGEPT
ncbi:hypothetical protein DJ82_11395 [Halorubrum sp. Ib24]|nr:hypothetical protein DJ82_11395 [Halorubrum sp. Ib24]OYR40395.1 hypothetical protein DJ81_14305 [Halorubrum sp. Hd13]OYR45795.1 hypothetical protein DJ75_07250 [Halorubrum sp. Eb13]OYR48517.1 hypothetical protein DJ74_10560 [Halorubrum sp. Ea8]OYR51001.1 hypothetical protein DJ73_14440 [Halorubrum sp. Ea1]